MIKILTVVDPQVPLSRLHYVGATMLPYDLCQSYGSEIDSSLLVYDDIGVDTLPTGVRIVNLGEPKARYQQQVGRAIEQVADSYDIIHVNISTPGFVKYMVEYPESLQKKIVYTMHTWTNSLAVSYYYVDYFKKLVTDSKVNIVFLTEVQKTSLLKAVGATEFNNPERVHIIHNSVNMKVTAPDHKESYAVCVGRMVESKCIDKIVKSCIDADQHLLVVSPPWRATPKEEVYRNKVMDLIKSAPDHLIELYEGLPHDDLMNLISHAKFGILMSSFDVFSLFMLECLFNNTPVLAASWGSTAEVCDILKDAGVMSFKNDKELVRLLKSNAMDRVSVDISKIPQDCFYDKFVNNYENLFKSLT